jgi:hypothetical protein
VLIACVPVFGSCASDGTDNATETAASAASTTLATTAPASTTTTIPRVDADRAAAEKATLRATDFPAVANKIPVPTGGEPGCVEKSVPVADRCVLVRSPFFVAPAGQGAGNSTIMFVPEASISEVLLDEYLGPNGLTKVRSDLESARAAMGGPEVPDDLARREGVATIGDESVAFRMAGIFDAVIFRKGRAFVRVSAINPTDGNDLAVELARKIANRLP